MNTTFLSSKDLILERLHFYICRHNRKLAALYDRIVLIAPESENCVYRLITICPDSICDTDGTALVHKAVLHCLATLQHSPIFKNHLSDSLFVTCCLCKELAEAVFTLAAVELHTSNGPWNLELALEDSYSRNIFCDSCVIYDSSPFTVTDKKSLLEKLTKELLADALAALRAPDAADTAILKIEALQ